MIRRAALALALLLALAPVAWAQNYNVNGTTTPALSVTAKSAANTPITATVPAGAAGFFHYITGVEIAHGCTTAVVGTAFLDITTTNLGSIAWSQGDACAVGSDHIVYYSFPNPIKSAVAATNTTVVCPAFGAAAFCRVTVYYFVAP